VFCSSLAQIDVLKEIKCIDSDLLVQIKGRVACEMNSGEELICTECLFGNQLDDLEPEEAAALKKVLDIDQSSTPLLFYCFDGLCFSFNCNTTA
jgi:antiviral helicase SKI2